MVYRQKRETFLTIDVKIKNNYYYILIPTFSAYATTGFAVTATRARTLTSAPKIRRCARTVTV